ncbi:MAG: hypothetical protein WCT46_02190 [Candidatus Gracilibacteria bacterium]|jgi:hypothetical protein
MSPFNRETNVLIGVEDDGLRELISDALNELGFPSNFNIHKVGGSLAGFIELQGGESREKFPAHLLIYDQDMYAYCKQQVVNIVQETVSGRVALLVICDSNFRQRSPGHGYDSSRMLIKFISAPPLELRTTFKEAVMRCLEFIG